MRHRRVRGNLSRTSAHRRAMINNMITSLFAHERIRTSVAKAKAARRVAERMITHAKRDTLHARRLVHRRIRDAEVLKKLFTVLGPRYQDRPGGYTRVIRLGARLGDGSETAILELVGRFVAAKPAGDEKPKRRRAKKAERAEAEAADVEEAEAEGSEAEEAADEEAADAADEAAGEADEAADEAAEGESADTEPEPEAKPKPKRRGFLRRRPRGK
jgi:large subunit ribosomal protein L17